MTNCQLTLPFDSPIIPLTSDEPPTRVHIPNLPMPEWYTGPWPWAAAANPTLDWWDAIVIASSGGKDSQAMTLWLSQQPAWDPARTYLIHNDTGQEHRGAFDKAQQTADHIGISTDHILITKPYLQRTMLDLVLQRRRWPGLSVNTRPCTNSLKRDPTDILLRRLGNNARILLLTGERREESSTRAKMVPWAFRRASAPTLNRLVMQWRPMLDWSTARIFKHISNHDQTPLWVYDADIVRSHVGPDGGAPTLAYSRASCAFCIYLRQNELETSFNLYPDLACLATKVEIHIDHRWRNDLALADIWAKIYGPSGYRAVDGHRLLALTPNQLIQRALGQPLAAMEPALTESLLAAANTRLPQEA